MDIKIESKEIVDPVTQYQSRLDSENPKNAADNEKNVFQMKIEQPDPVQEYSGDEQMGIQTNLNIPPVCSTDTLPSNISYWEVQIDENDVKKECDDAEHYNKRPSFDCSGNGIVFSGLEARIKLHRVPIHSRNFVCCVCFDTFSTIDEQKTHKLGHIRPSNHIGINKTNNEVHFKQYEPSIKHNDARRKRHLKPRNVTHIGKKRFKCDQCDYSSVRSNDLKPHKMTHSGEKPLKCDQCKYVCLRSGDLNVHKRTHSTNKRFKCDECDYACLKSDSLKVHKMLHSGDKPFKCDDCSSAFTRLGGLNKHKMIHSVKKPIKCENCDYTCGYLSVLKVHKLTHSSKKLFKCEICNDAFKQLRGLELHRVVHSNLKPFSCEFCKFTFKRIGDLKHHRLTHSGEKPFKCDDCEYSCKRSSYLKSHKKIHGKKL